MKEVRSLMNDSCSWYVLISLDAKTASCEATPSRKVSQLRDLLLSVSSGWVLTQQVAAGTTYLGCSQVGWLHYCTSQVADFLIHTLSDLDPGILLQYIMLWCFPLHVHDALATTEADDLKKLAGEEDQILDFPPGQATYSALRGSHQCSPAEFTVPSSSLPSPWNYTGLDAMDPILLHLTSSRIAPQIASVIITVGLGPRLGNVVCHVSRCWETPLELISVPEGLATLLEMTDQHSCQVFLEDTGPASMASTSQQPTEV